MSWNKRMMRRCCVGLATLVTLAAGAAGSASAQYADTGDTDTATQEQIPVERKTSYRYKSDEGNFEVTWPSGCGKLRIRANDPEFFEGEDDVHQILVNHVSCDRTDLEGDGCSVTATFDSRSTGGGPAGPQQVIARVQNALKTYGVTVTKQVPMRKEFPNGLVVEGLDVMGTGPNGKGEIMVRGMLAAPDIYVLIAWSIDGEVWDNPVYQEFFNDFIPYLE